MKKKAQMELPTQGQWGYECGVGVGAGLQLFRYMVVSLFKSYKN